MVDLLPIGLKSDIGVFTGEEETTYQDMCWQNSRFVWRKWASENVSSEEQINKFYKIPMENVWGLFQIVCVVGGYNPIIAYGCLLMRSVDLCICVNMNKTL